MTEKKIGEIMEVTNRFLPERLAKNLKEIQENYAKNPIVYIKGYLDCLKKIFDETKRLQDEGKKGKTAYISFSFLYSNTLLNKNGLRIDIYDKDFYLDKREVCAFWEPSEIFQYVEEDMKYMERQLNSSYIPLDSNEFVELYNSYLTNYYEALVQILVELVKLIEKMKCFQEMQNEREVMITMGDYMDKYQCIYKIFIEDK